MILAVYLITALLLIVVALVVFRIFVRRDYERKGRLTRFSGFLQLLLFSLHVLSSYVYLDPRLSHIRTDSPLFVPAIACMVAGLVLLALAMGGLGISVAMGLRVTGLRKSGLYRYTRNPQIVTGSLFYVGCAMLWPSWTGFIWLGLLWIILHIMVLTEEEHLRRTFGEEYECYCAETPRYLGFHSG